MLVNNISVIMEDVEKELGPLFDNYIKKYENSKVKRYNQLSKNLNFKSVFNQLVKNVIEPVMHKYNELVKKKGFTTSISHEAGHQVTLRFTVEKSLDSELLPAIKFVAENRKISIYENKFDPYGLGCTSKEGTYETYQITESFVNEKLSKFFTVLLE
jgi:valyl-tRNA synthetase